MPQRKRERSNHKEHDLTGRGEFDTHTTVFQQKKFNAIDQMIERTTPPSTRSTAPLIAEQSELAMNVTSEAPSSVEAKRLSGEIRFLSL